MSNLPDRSESPRRRITRGGMHPGWAVFLLAWTSGMFTVFAMVSAIRVTMGWDRIGTLIVTATIAIATFLAAGRKAEKLTDGDEI